MVAKQQNIFWKILKVFRFMVYFLILLLVTLIIFPYEKIVDPVINNWLMENKVDATIRIDRIDLLSGLEISGLQINSLEGFKGRPIRVKRLVLEYSPLAYLFERQISVNRLLLDGVDFTYEMNKSGMDNIGALLGLIITKLNLVKEIKPLDEVKNGGDKQSSAPTSNQQYVMEIRKAIRDLVIDIGKMPIVATKVDLTNLNGYVLMKGIDVSAENISFHGCNVTTMKAEGDGAGTLLLSENRARVLKNNITANEIAIRIDSFKTRGQRVDGALRLKIKSVLFKTGDKKISATRLAAKVRGMVTTIGETDLATTLSIARMDAKIAKDKFKVNGMYFKTRASYGQADDLVFDFALSSPKDFEVYGVQDEKKFMVEIPMSLYVTSKDYNRFEIKLKAPVNKLRGDGIFGKAKKDKINLLSSGYLDLKQDKMLLQPIDISINEKPIVTGHFKIADLQKDAKMNLLLENLRITNLGAFTPLAILAFPALKITNGIKIVKDNFTFRLTP